MTLACMIDAYQCCPASGRLDGCAIVTTGAIDLTITITCLVLGLLGCFSVIGMPAAASYSLIGVAGGIPLFYLLSFIGIKLCAQRCRQALEARSESRYEYRSRW